jgi:hypothetical protein
VPTLNRDPAIGLLDRLHKAQNEFYGFATIRDVDHRWSTVGLYDVSDQQITACWLLPLDQHAFDAIWSA